MLYQWVLLPGGGYERRLRRKSSSAPVCTFTNTSAVRPVNSIPTVTTAAAAAAAVAAAGAAAAAKTGMEVVEEEGGARGRERKAGGDTRRRRSERGGRRGRQGITGRAERDDAARDEGERTGYHIATSTDHLSISSANP